MELCSTWPELNLTQNTSLCVSLGLCTTDLFFFINKIKMLPSELFLWSGANRVSCWVLTVAVRLSEFESESWNSNLSSKVT